MIPFLSFSLKNPWMWRTVQPTFSARILMSVLFLFIRNLKAFLYCSFGFFIFRLDRRPRGWFLQSLFSPIRLVPVRSGRNNHTDDCKISIYLLLQSLPCFELCNFLFRNIYRRSRLWIPALLCLSCRYRKRSKSNQCYRRPFL